MQGWREGWRPDSGSEGGRIEGGRKAGNMGVREGGMER